MKPHVRPYGLSQKQNSLKLKQRPRLYKQGELEN